VPTENLKIHQEAVFEVKLNYTNTILFKK